jgi:signal transduction histidine kinase
MYLHITSSCGEILFSSLAEECKSCLMQPRKLISTNTCPVTGTQRRSAVSTTPRGRVYLCEEASLLKSRRIARERLQLYHNLIPELSEVRKSLVRNADKHMRRLMHNLTSQNAHNIQDVYDIVPQDSLGATMSEQIGIVESALLNDPNKAARALLRINKHNAAMKCEFAALKHLYGGNTPALRARHHNVFKVTMNALHLFYQDFREKGIIARADPCDNKAKFDYECIHVALYHLFENAAKYILENTVFAVSFPIEEGRQRVRLDMVSLQISDSDLPRLFVEGFSGQVPRSLGFAGNGLGLGIARDLLRLNGAELQIHRNVDPSRSRTTVLAKYEHNVIDIVLGTPV